MMINTKSIFSNALCACALISVILTGGAAISAHISSPAAAQEFFGSCDQITNDVEAMECVRSHKDKILDQLNILYDDLSASLDAPALEKLRDAQTHWVQYRTQQCAMEGELAKQDSLKTLYRLECIEQLTQSRYNHLSRLYNWNNDNQPRQFGEYPKWINILERNYPQIFWDLKSAQEFDINCDGSDEYIIAGVDVAGGTQPVLSVVNVNGGARAVEYFSVIDAEDMADTTNMGDISDTPNAVENKTCAPYMIFSQIDYDQAAGNDQTAEAPAFFNRKKPEMACTKALSISFKSCNQSYILQYIDDKAPQKYQLSNPTSDETTTLIEN